MTTARTAAPDVSIVVPIYNEVENLPDLVERIAHAMAAQPLGFELLAVSLPTAILNIGFCLLLSYLTAPVLLELIFVSYLYQK